MQFGLLEMWQSMSPLAKAVAILLITMSIVSLYFFIEREMFFRRAKSRSKEIAPKLADMLKIGQVKEALSAWERSLKLNPNQPELGKKIEGLKDKK